MNSAWQEIKDKLRIEDVIGDYVQIQPAGSNFRCLCPFHREKSPSLIVSPEKQVWHCFGCGEGGDIFGFVSQIENISRKEALEKLAKKAGVSLSSFKKQSSEAGEYSEEIIEPVESSKHQNGLKVLSWTAEVFHKVLLKLLQDRNHPVTQYCLQRNLSQEIIEKFQLGYAPTGNFLLKLIQKYHLDANLLAEVGVLKLTTYSDQHNDVVDTSNSVIRSHKAQEPEYSDKFKDRLMIPVFNRNGEVVGFTGRVLPYDKTERPKYLNSPQSQWFNKSDLWFGWHVSKRSIVQKKEVIIVEGNMDVISAHKAGHENVLASQGTSFTSTQLRNLQYLTKRILLAFDNDQAGLVSSIKFFKSASSLGFVVHKVIIPKEHKDIDEYLSANPDVQLQHKPYLDWLFAEKYQELISSDSELQKKAITECIEVIAVVDLLSQEQYIKKLSEISKISVLTLQTLLGEVKPTTQPTVIEEEPKYKSISVDQSLNVTFQNLVAANSETGKIDAETMDALFGLLKKIVNPLNQFENFEEYLNGNKELLGLIVQEKPKYKDPEFIENSWRSIIHVIDQRVSSIMLFDDAKDNYLKIKSHQL